MKSYQSTCVYQSLTWKSRFLDTGSKLNVHKKIRRHPKPLLNAFKYTICVQEENPETYSIATIEMKKEQMFYDCIAIKYDQLQTFIDSERGLEDLLWLFLSSIFMFLRRPIRDVFKILSNICDGSFSWKYFFERSLDKFPL